MFHLKGKNGQILQTKGLTRMQQTDLCQPPLQQKVSGRLPCPDGAGRVRVQPAGMIVVAVGQQQDIWRQLCQAMGMIFAAVDLQAHLVCFNHQAALQEVAFTAWWVT
ncbi:MAG: hypothetical protein Tsb0017_17620 [Geothermobacteraceae bacterium]